MDQQQALQYAKGLMDSGMSAADANVELVRMIGVRLVGRMDASHRAALMGAVKTGRLGRLAKDGAKPEAFFHPNAEATAREQRNAAAAATVRALLAVCA